MSDVKQTIQVTNTGLSPILSIAQGTGMVDFEFTISDFQIPAGSTAVAWNIQPTGNIVSQVCTLVENVITVTPPAYYFLRGKNYMQIQVTGADGVNLFTFLIEVWCSPNISAPVVSQNPDLITQLMAMIGNTQDLDTTAKNNLVAAINEIYARGVVDILDTEEEIEANTDAGKATGALVTKQLISDFGGCTFSVQSDGAYVTYTPSGGADPVSKKLGDLTFVQAISADGLQHTVDCTHVQGYTFLTNDSFIFNFKEVSYQTVNHPGEGSTSQNYPLTYNYDSETGMLTYSGGGRHTITSGWDVYITSDIDLYVK